MKAMLERFKSLRLVRIMGFNRVVLIGVIILLWRLNIEENRQEELLLKNGKKLPTNNEVFMSLFDKKTTGKMILPIEDCTV